MDNIVINVLEPVSVSYSPQIEQVNIGVTESTEVVNIVITEAKNGLSAYEVMVKNGYTGTEQDWAAYINVDHTVFALKTESSKTIQYNNVLIEMGMWEGGNGPYPYTYAILLNEITETSFVIVSPDPLYDSIVMTANILSKVETLNGQIMLTALNQPSGDFYVTVTATTVCQ